jgi:deoxyribodipyrimidine photo-lyase
LSAFPDLRTVGIRKHYDATEWVSPPEEAARRLRAWQRGVTGYPIVDAGMRELWKTGWMCQSVRMVVASFLVEYLRCNWVEGEKWFFDTLVDSDSAINAMMWQNAGRSGIDQWNFVLSPENASQDPSGEYTRLWCPELAKLSNQYIHTPWKAPSHVLQRAGVQLAVTYPERIVEDLPREREASVEAVLRYVRESE